MAKKKELSDSFDSMFIHDDITAQEPEQNPKAKKPAAKEQQKEEPKESKGEGAVFSVRLNKDIWAQWKAYNEAKGENKKGAISEETGAAIVEYMKKHPLKAEQIKDYEFYLPKFKAKAEEKSKK